MVERLVKNIYLIRHGQTIWNEQRRMQGAKDSELTKLGIKETIALSKRVKDMKLDEVYSSPLGRTRQTKKLALGERKLPVTLLKEIQEMDFGILEGMVFEEASEKYPEVLDNLWNKPKLYVNETGESFEDVKKRIERGLDIIDSSKVKDIMVVSHGIIIGMIINMALGKGIESIWDRPVVRNTSMTTIKLNGQGLELVDLDDISHLEEIK